MRWRCLDSIKFPYLQIPPPHSTPMIRGVLWPPKQSTTRFFTSHDDRVVAEVYLDRLSRDYLSTYSVLSIPAITSSNTHCRSKNRGPTPSVAFSQTALTSSRELEAQPSRSSGIQSGCSISRVWRSVVLLYC